MLLAVDQGTTNTKALLIDRNGATVHHATVPTSLHIAANGDISQDLDSIWHGTHEVLRLCAAWAGENQIPIEGLCLTNQRETAAAWDRESGKPLTHAISWQCRRSSVICDRVVDAAAKIQQTTGLPLDPLLSATKWAWMLSHEERVQQAAQAGKLALGTIDSWLLFRLTEGKVHATDTTNASRTGLLDLDRMQWDDSLLSLFGIKAAWLPKVMASAARFGVCDEGLGIGTLPIVAIAGDSHAALIGHGDFAVGAIKATYGTGSSLMALVSSSPLQTSKLARTVAWTLPGDDLSSTTQYALEGNITMSGAALQWVGQFLGLADPAAQSAKLAAQVPDADGVTFIPAMAGLGAPHWSSSAKGLVCGLSPHHRAEHLARAALDAIAMQVADVFEQMRVESSLDLPSLRADGGATRNSALMQLQADVLGVPVYRSFQEELSALGVARLGGLVLGRWKDLSSAEVLQRSTETFTPLLSSADRQRLRDAWRLALDRALLDKVSQ
ncbi:MAG TPA: FGGY family carbohydrate kinase [Acidobacteriaceae bacterium]|nr:FGGY family carbohydrate kinase [Acidobacteriaceae bacterium]